MRRHTNAEATRPSWTLPLALAVAAAALLCTGARAGAAPTGPAALTPPSLLGVAREGATLSADPGLWNAQAAATFTYAWQKCSAAGTSCAAISGATGAGYQLPASAVGATLRVGVTAADASGSTTAWSPVSGVVAPSGDVPAASALPEVHGTVQQGQQLSATSGSWNGALPISFGYRWLRCATGGGACAAISGATSATYTPTATDIGSMLRPVVTASNTAGVNEAGAAPTAAVVSADAPALATRPTIAGTPKQDQALTASPGTWSGASPLSFAYQWWRCDAAGGVCTQIGGADTAVYTPVAADAGHALRASVEAANAAGAATALTTATDPVAASTPDAPVNTAPPAIGGAVRVGNKLTASSGTWSGATPITFTYAWQSCASNGSDCRAITGASSTSYTPTIGDLGRTLRVVVVATNASGAAGATSPAVTVGAPDAPYNLALPIIYASTTALREGQVVSASTGSWVGASTIYYDFSWNRCTNRTFASCRPIAGAHKQSYTLKKDDVGHQLMVLVKAHNRFGASFADSQITPAGVSRELHAAIGPSLSGTPAVGSTLTAAQGTWTAAAPISFTYQWTRCARGCAPIPGAKSKTYTLTQADVGHQVFVQVKATVGGKSVFANSGRTRSISAAPATGTMQVAAVSLPDRLVISGVQFQPSAIDSLAPFTARFRVTEQNAGRPVQGALVYALGIPYSWVTGGREVVTDANGWATITITPTAELPLTRGTALVLFVRARKPGDNLLAGVSTRRLVQIVVRPRSLQSADASTAPYRTASTPIGSVSLPNRLVISGVQFVPSRLGSRAPFIARFRVTDTHGTPVAGALVYALGLPYGWVQAAREVATDDGGWATVVVTPTARLPLTHGSSLVMFVRARKPGQNLLGGVSTRRLVQVTVR